LGPLPETLLFAAAQDKGDAAELQMQRTVSARTPEGQALLMEQRRLHPTRAFYPGQLYEAEVPLPSTCPGPDRYALVLRLCMLCLHAGPLLWHASPCNFRVVWTAS
jgi:hypothetical protein